MFWAHAFSNHSRSILQILLLELMAIVQTHIHFYCGLYLFRCLHYYIPGNIHMCPDDNTSRFQKVMHSCSGNMHLAIIPKMVWSCIFCCLSPTSGLMYVFTLDSCISFPCIYTLWSTLCHTLEAYYHLSGPKYIWNLAVMCLHDRTIGALISVQMLWTGMHLYSCIMC